MFAKSKRFDDKPVGCGADVTYDLAKGEAKSVGGVIPKVERFRNDKSDTESVASDKSAQVFRTPKTIRRNIINSTNKKLMTTKSCGNIKCETNKPFIDDVVKSKEVEIRNKDATIAEYEQQMKEFNCKITDLTTEITSLQENSAKLQEDLSSKSTIRSPDRKINELKENLALVKSHHALALEANESIRHEYKMEIDTLKVKHDEEMEIIINRHKSEMEKLNGTHQTDVRKLKSIEEDCISQIKWLEENSVEKVKICEVQYEERLQELKTYTDSVLSQEKQKWQEEMNKCQNFAESEIMKLELQIQELKQQLEVSSKNVKELSNNVSTLQKTIDAKENQLEEAYCKIQLTENLANNQKSEHLNEISAFTNKLHSVNLERNNFSLILETTRQTMEALSVRLQHSDEDVEVLKEELEKAQKDLHDYKTEHNELLLSIVDSKTVLDEKHQNILDRNAELSQSLIKIESEFVGQIETMKKDFTKEIDYLKSHTLILVNDLEEKNMQEHIKYLEIKEKCDQAYCTIEECRNIMFNAECQLETKDQDLNELETENNRLSGTLAAVEQEKNELHSLLNEFKLLLESKDQKIHDYINNIADNREKVEGFESQIKKISDLLEITEFIMKEKESDNEKLQENIAKVSQVKEKLELHVSEMNLQLDEYEAQNNELLMKQTYDKSLLQEEIKKLNSQNGCKDDDISDLRKKLADVQEQSDKYEKHMEFCNTEPLQLLNGKLEKDLEEITIKYTDLLGHQNNKQKIKHVIDLKTQNNTLRDENDKLLQTITTNNTNLQKQTTQIDKLKKEIDKLKKEIEFNRKMSPAKMLSISTPKGKENTPIGKSPKVKHVPSPLRELNR